jgi:hypothetical protein
MKLLYTSAMPNMPAAAVAPRTQAVNAGVRISPVTSNYVSTGATNFHGVGALDMPSLSTLAIIGAAAFAWWKWGR